MEAEPTVEYYTCEHDVEQLTYTDMNDAIEYHLNGLCGVPLAPTVTVYRYARGVVSKSQMESAAEYALEGIIERLDEDHGNPEEATDATNEMKAIMVEAVQKVVDLYHVWSCEEVKPPLEVNTTEWIRKNAPEWLKNEGLKAEVERLEKEAQDEEPSYRGAHRRGARPRRRL